MRMRKTFLWSMIASLAIAAALGVIAIIFDSYRSTSEKILVTSLLVSAFSLTALAAAIVLDRHRHRAISWFGISASLLALFVWNFMIWLEPWRWTDKYDIDELLAKIGTTFTIVAIWSPHVGLLAMLRLDRAAYHGVRRATWGMISMLALMILYVAWMEEFEDWSGRTIGVLAILAACGTVVTPVLAIVERVTRRDSADTIEKRIEVDLTCPRCGVEQPIRTGSAKCTGCGLRIRIDVEEPRCECGYLLYQLEGDVCPECGRSIEDQDRWAKSTSRT